MDKLEGVEKETLHYGRGVTGHYITSYRGFSSILQFVCDLKTDQHYPLIRCRKKSNRSRTVAATYRLIVKGFPCAFSFHERRDKHRPDM